VIRVVPALEDITVNGRSLDGVRPDIHSYDVIVPDSITAAPALDASVSEGSVEVYQPEDLPGTGTVVVTSDDGVEQSYAVHFARPATSDEFDSAAPGPQWRWIRHTANGGGSAAPGTLRINAEPGDLLSTPTSTTNNARNLLVQRALGDWTIESKIDFAAAPNSANQQAGIMAYQDDDNYLRFALEASGTPATPQLSVTTEDSRSCCDPGYTQGSGPVSQTLAAVRPAGITATTKTVWLRMTKEGPRYRMWYSTDGTSFSPVYETGAPLEDVDVGLFAFNRAGSTLLPVYFDYFRISGQSKASDIPAPPATPEEPGDEPVTPGATATPTPTPAAPASGTPGARPDKTQPRLRLRSSARQSLKVLRTRGLGFQLSADEPVRLSVRLLGRLRSKHGGRGPLRELARGSRTGVRAGQVVTLRLEPSAALRRKLRTERRLPAQVRITATDAAGNVTTRTKTLSFR
jgi:regulation of enolase protein 1 (concanavalin A-like superfamily)